MKNMQRQPKQQGKNNIRYTKQIVRNYMNLIVEK